MTNSSIFEGNVRHQRMSPKPHGFRYRLFMMYVDLDEVSTLFERRWFWSARRPNLGWFRRADYMRPTERPLKEVVLDRVESELGHRPSGSVCLLTQVRTMGYVFNPVSFYFCHGEDGQIEAIVAEITNTPWGERHAYVLDGRGFDGHEVLWWRFDKDFHVSPFFDMDQSYEWSFRAPGDVLEVRMTNWEDGKPVFHVGFDAVRKPLNARSLARALLRFPVQSARLHLAIYWQAARLYLKRTPFFTHPDKRPDKRMTKEDALMS